MTRHKLASSRAPKAKGCVEHDQHEERHRNINWTISLIEALRGALNFEEGGDIASNLDMLYDYMIRRLYDANVQNDVESLQEVSSLLKEIKKAWEAMPELIKRAENIQDAVGSA